MQDQQVKVRVPVLHDRHLVLGCREGHWGDEYTVWSGILGMQDQRGNHEMIINLLLDVVKNQCNLKFTK
jgi:hypothetical protein